MHCLSNKGQTSVKYNNAEGLWVGPREMTKLVKKPGIIKKIKKYNNIIHINELDKLFVSESDIREFLYLSPLQI
jgi:hypothetical protein